jgi:prolycopene isomerase
MDALKTDVLVIGSGLGSLTAAALLAKKGIAVTVLEQHFQPGGSCGAFRRLGRTFDQGTAMMFGFGEQGFNPHRFVMNELEEPISVIKHQYLYKLNYAGTPIIFHSDMEAFFAQLAQLFPDDMDGIRAFYRYIGDLYFNVITAAPICVAPSEIPKAEGARMFLRHPLRNLKLFSLFSKSAGDLMRRFVTSEKVIEFFNKLTSTYCYTLLDETPAILAVTMFMDNHFGGSYYPVGSTQQLPGKLERALERLGGEIRYNSKVVEILFKEGKPCGVVAETPEGMVHFEANSIIYGGTLLNFHTKLVPPAYRDPQKVEWVRNLKMTYPSVVLYCIVPDHILPAGTLPVEMMADNPHHLDEKEVTMYAFSLADPSLCQPGEHVVMAIGPSLDKWPGAEDHAYHETLYLTQRELEKQRLLEVMESHFPGFKTSVRYATVATPTTIERFTLKNRGCVAGPKQSMGQDLLNRQHASSEWPDVFFCGEATVMGTGSPAVTISGVSAANMVLRQRKLSEYRWKPPVRDIVETLDAHAPSVRYDSPTKREERKQYAGSIPERVPGKQGEIPHPLGAEKEALPPLSRACPGGIDTFHAHHRPLPSLNMMSDPTEIALHDAASACQWCDPAACTFACPVAFDIRGILRRLECGNTLGAYKLISRTPDERAKLPCLNCAAPCETSCLRKEFDPQGVSVRATLMQLAQLAQIRARHESDIK